MQADDFDGLYAIIPTPARPNADHWNATDTVNVEETARLVENLITEGISGILALGTTGECATLTAPEYETFVSCVVETVGGRVPTFIGATALGTHEVIHRLQFVHDIGATGTLLGLPMWQPLTTAMAVSYYRDMSEAFPDLSVMVYANARAFRYAFPSEFWLAIVKEAPTVTSAKVSRSVGLKEAIEVTGGAIRFLPNEMKLQEFQQIAPIQPVACWATAASMGPALILALLHAARTDETLMSELSASIAWAHEPIAELLADQDAFASYNIQIEKVRMQTAGYCNPGPVRPPYAMLPDRYEVGAQECGRRWRELCDRITLNATVDTSNRGN